MPLLGRAALAMWWNIDPQVRADFEDWHSHEHFRERLGIPGFRRASRWADADGGEGFFVMYELDGHEVLSSAAYAARLNAPTPWSTRLMPHHRDMVRSQCRVLESGGGAIGRHVLTLRLSPAADGEERLRAWVAQLVARLPERPGLVGVHLLKHQTPQMAQTTEQRIRGSNDQGADWVIVAGGYELAALRALAADELAAGTLAREGALPDAFQRLYTLSYCATPGDVA